MPGARPFALFVLVRGDGTDGVLLVAGGIVRSATPTAAATTAASTAVVIAGRIVRAPAGFILRALQLGVAGAVIRAAPAFATTAAAVVIAGRVIRAVALDNSNPLRAFRISRPREKAKLP